MQNNLHAFDHGGLAADVCSLETENSGVYVYEICFRVAQSPALLEWEMPMLDIAGLWHPCCGMDRGIKADWYSPVKNMTSRSAPVMTFYNSLHVQSLRDSERASHLRRCPRRGWNAAHSYSNSTGRSAGLSSAFANRPPGIAVL